MNGAFFDRLLFLRLHFFPSPPSLSPLTPQSFSFFSVQFLSSIHFSPLSFFSIFFFSFPSFPNFSLYPILIPHPSLYFSHFFFLFSLFYYCFYLFPLLSIPPSPSSSNLSLQPFSTLMLLFWTDQGMWDWLFNKCVECNNIGLNKVHKSKGSTLFVVYV